jgi:sodium transport system permease protein
MSSSTTAGSQVSRPRFNLARVLRMARKELRETLRDRRTMITLVLMPLLVYPVLSLAFRQFLLSSFQHSSELRFHIYTSNQEEWRTLMLMLAQGDQLLKEHESASASTPLSGGPILGADLGATEPALMNNDIGALREDVNRSLEELVRNNEIDLGVRLLPREEGRGSRDQSRFQLIYRPNTPISRQAASFVERRLRAVNEHDLQERLASAGVRRSLRAVWRLKPVGDEEGHSFWLGTLVPLVLILMTITGAVYPAIDLTAGERERGTLEALMAAPVPRLGLLTAKYIAVLSVAVLTAVVNLVAMTLTITASGLGTILFGDKGLSPQSIVAVLILLVLFAAFFSAVLLTITSFARSFKEAQAYLIPLMVLSLAPGYMSVMPGLELGPVLSVIPLANIVLLARDVLEGDAPLIWGAVAVLSTILYGGAALALAARIFGSDAILYGSEGSWGDFFRRPREPRWQATIPGALTTLAIVVPMYVIVSGLLAQLQSMAMVSQLLAAAGTSLILFVIIPLSLAKVQGLRLPSAFQLRPASMLILAAAVVLGCTLWPLAYDLIIACQHFGIATLSAEKLAENRPAFESLVERLRSVSPGVVLFALALVPAIGEELFFRGYLLGALRGRLPAWGAVAATAAVFGVFHASVGGLIAVERILSSTLLGIVLGWLCWRAGSVIPSMALHTFHNGLMVSLAYWAPRLTAWGWDVEGQRFLPLPLVVTTSVAAGIALGAVAWITRSNRASALQPSALPQSPEPG